VSSRRFARLFFCSGKFASKGNVSFNYFQNNEELEAKVEELSRNLAERTKNLEEANEVNSFFPLPDVQCYIIFKANALLGKQLKDLGQNLTECGTKLPESIEKKV